MGRRATSATASPTTRSCSCAVPFTPATGARLLAARRRGARARSRARCCELARSSRRLVAALLFPGRRGRAALRAAGLLERSGVQFHWRNAGYASFDDFLAALSHDKRKKIRQERRKVAEAGVTLAPRDRARGDARPTGTSSRAATGAPTASTARRPTSTASSSAMLAERMPDNVLLVIAERDGTPDRGGARPLRRRRALRALLGRDRARPRPALRGLLLPGDRVLHRARHRALRGRRAGRAQARARLPARGDALLPLARAPGVRARDRRLPRARGGAHRGVRRRAERAHAVQEISRPRVDFSPESRAPACSEKSTLGRPSFPGCGELLPVRRRLLARGTRGRARPRARSASAVERAAHQLEAQVEQVGVGDVGLAVVADRRRSRRAGTPATPASRPCRACRAARRAARSRRAAPSARFW